MATGGHSNTTDTETLKKMVMSFRVQELQTLLSFGGFNKMGRKTELQARALKLLRMPNDIISKLIQDLYSKVSQGAVYGINSHQEQAKKDTVTSGTQEMKMGHLPFYHLLYVLIKPSYLTLTSLQKMQETNLTFNLTAQQANEITLNRRLTTGFKMVYQVQVQLRFCLTDESGQHDDVFPPYVTVRVNGKFVPLPNPLPTNRQGSPPKRPQVPLDITCYTKASPMTSNIVLVAWSAECGQGYSVAVYLVRKLTPDHLLCRLLQKGASPPPVTVRNIKQKLIGDSDCELATSSLQVSLLCPLGKIRINHPCRATTCKHLQCFDASLFFQMNEKKSTWICPVCYQPALYENLQIDGYFSEVLSSPQLPADSTEIVLHKDGTWSAVDTKEQAQSRPSLVEDLQETENDRDKPADDTSFIDLTLSDDEEIVPLSTENGNILSNIKNSTSCVQNTNNSAVPSSRVYLPFLSHTTTSGDDVLNVSTPLFLTTNVMPFLCRDASSQSPF